MSFDAGAIVARMRIDLQQFRKDADEAERRMDRLARNHNIKVSAVFDDASMAKARHLFAQLDQQLSRDAMQRLRSSPQGSVLGALNALFSPHQVSGGPTAQQAGSQGLLGRMVGAGGSGGAVGTSATPNQNANAGSVIQRVIQRAAGPAPSAPDATQNVRLNVDPNALKAAAKAAGAQAGDDAGQAFSDRFRAKLASNAILGRMFSGVVAGARKAGADAGNAAVDAAAKAAATNKNSGFFGRLLGGIGPGITGVGAKTATGIGLGGALLGAVPALGALGGAGLFAGAGLGALGLLNSAVNQSNVKSLVQQTNQQQAAAAAAVTPQQKLQAAQQLQGINQSVAQLSPALQQIYKAEVAINNQWQQIGQDMAGVLAGPLTAIANLLTSLTPIIEQTFGAAGKLATPFIQGLTDLAKTVLPILAQGFTAVAPLIKPLLDGIAALVGPLLGGLVTLVKAAAPAIHAFAGGLGDIGTGLGKMFADFAPVVKASSTILSALFDVIGGLFPIIGKLAAIMASALAPVFVQFAGLIKSLLPFLITIGKVVGALAGAVLGDLVAALSAVVKLLVAIAPGLTAFANSLSGVFTVLENSGIFAILGNSLEAIVVPLAKLINAILKGLAPILPPVINFIAQLSALLAQQLANAVIALLPPLTKLATAVFGALNAILPAILPLLLTFAQIFTTALVTAISGVATAVAAVINAIPPAVLQAIVTGILAIVAAIKLWALAQVAINLLLDANPIGLIIIALAALGVAIFELAKHWHQVWTDIKNWAEDAWHFLTHGWGQFLIPGLTLVRVAVEFVRDHWKQAWDDMKGAALAAWNFIINDIIHPLENFFTKTIPDAFKTSVSAIANFWNGLVSAVEGPVNAVIGILNDLIGAFDAITNALGLGKPIGKIPTLGGGGGAGGGGGGGGGGKTAMPPGRNAGGGHPVAAQHGYRIPGWGGGDRHLILGEAGELVLPKEAAEDPLAAILATKYKVPGYQLGGIIGTILGSGWNALKQLVPGLGIGQALTGAAAEGILSKIASRSAGGHGLLGTVLSALERTVLKEMESWLGGHRSTGGSSGSAFSGPGGGQPAANAALARRLFPAWGSGANWANWNNVAMAESGWNNTIWNAAGSGAYGIAQALPFTKYPKPGWPPSAGGTSNPTAQISWMHDYIQSVYGSPAAAWAHEVSQHWYDGGGWMRPGHGLSMNGTGQAEAVLTPGQSSAFMELSRAAQMSGGTGVTDRLDSMIMLLGSLIDTTAAAPVSMRSGLAEAFGTAGRQATFRKRFPVGGS